MGKCLDFQGAVIPKLLPLSHGDPMSFRKKVSILPVVLAPPPPPPHTCLRSAHGIRKWCVVLLRYTCLLSYHCAPTSPPRPFRFHFSKVRKVNSLGPTAMPLFVKSNVISTRVGSFHCSTRLNCDIHTMMTPAPQTLEWEMTKSFVLFLCSFFLADHQPTSLRKAVRRAPVARLISWDARREERHADWCGQPRT